MRWSSLFLPRAVARLVMGLVACGAARGDVFGFAGLAVVELAGDDGTVLNGVQGMRLVLLVELENHAAIVLVGGAYGPDEGLWRSQALELDQFGHGVQVDRVFAGGASLAVDGEVEGDLDGGRCCHRGDCGYSCGRQNYRRQDPGEEIGLHGVTS